MTDKTVNPKPAAAEAALRTDEASRGGRLSHLPIALRLLGISALMFGFGYLMVPLYEVICDITGLNGKTGRITIAEAEQRQQAQSQEREIIVEFVGIVNAGGAWDFGPNERTMTVRPGQTYKTTFHARNLSSEDAVGQASPSVSPSAAARYFNKTECFCFTRQEFAANSERDMPITFVIDSEIPTNIDRVTLSYTFFRSKDQEQLSSAPMLIQQPGGA